MIVMAAFIFSSCHQSNEEMKERIIGSDSVAINFFRGDGNLDTVVAVKIIRDSGKIAQLAKFISAGSSSKKQNCGYDGSIHFFKMSRVIQDINFRMNQANCMHFSFFQNGEFKTSELSTEAKALLDSWRK